MTSKEKLIYLAGIIDGEGHFYLPNIKPGGRVKSYPTPCIVVTNTNLELIEWIKTNFNGYYTKTGKSTKQCYQWRIYNSKARSLAIELQPYLIVKKEQVLRIL